MRSTHVFTISVSVKLIENQSNQNINITLSNIVKTFRDKELIRCTSFMVKLRKIEWPNGRKYMRLMRQRLDCLILFNSELLDYDLNDVLKLFLVSKILNNF